MVKKSIKVFLIYLELFLMSVIVIVPIVWIVLSSFNKGNGLATSGFLPKELTIDNYKKLFTETSYTRWFFNSFCIATLNALCSVFLVTITAWVMSRFKFKGKKFSLLFMLLLSMFPTFLSMTAIYTLFYTLGLLDKPIALVVIYVAGAIPYNIWLVKGYIDGIPRDIEEASYIDGCSYPKAFFKITIPMCTPIIAYCAVSQFMMPWMDYILPNLLLSGEKNKTLAVGLYSMITGKENSFFTTFAAGAVIIAIPMTLLFLFFQKYLVNGISAGANKG